MEGLKRWWIKNGGGWNVKGLKRWINEWKEVPSSEGLGTGRLKFARMGRGLGTENEAEACEFSQPL